MQEFIRISNEFEVLIYQIYQLWGFYGKRTFKDFFWTMFFQQILLLYNWYI